MNSVSRLREGWALLCPARSHHVQKGRGGAGGSPEEVTKRFRGQDNLRYGDGLGELELFSLENIQGELRALPVPKQAESWRRTLYQGLE